MKRNFKMKRNFAKTLALTLALCFGLMCVPATTVFAAEEGLYDLGDYNGEWIMDNNHGHNQHVTLYVLTENNVNYTTYEYRFPFICYDNLPEEYENGETFKTRVLAYDGRLIEETAFGSIYAYTFGIKAGNYTFSFPECNGDFFALTQTFESPRIGAGYYTNDNCRYGTNYEIVNIAPGTSEQVYAMLGSPEWYDDPATMEFLIDWAKKYDAEITKRAGLEVQEEEQEKEEPSELKLSFGSEKEEESFEENEISEEITTEEVVIPPSKEENDFPWALFIVGFVSVAIVGGALIFVFRNK